MIQSITIIGSGVSAIHALIAIRKYRQDVMVNLIAPIPVLRYYDNLGTLLTHDIDNVKLDFDLSDLFLTHNVNYIADEVIRLESNNLKNEQLEGVELENSMLKNNLPKNQTYTLFTKSGKSVKTSAIIIAQGASFNHKPNGLEHTINPSNIENLLKIKTRINNLTSGTIALGFDKKIHAKNSVEILLEIQRYIQQNKKQKFLQLTLFSSNNDDIPSLLNRNIKCYFSKEIKAFNLDTIHLAEEDLTADLILFFPTLSGQSWLVNSVLTKDENNILKVDKKCCVEQENSIFAIGDCANNSHYDLFEQGVISAKNALLALENKTKIHILEKNKKAIPSLMPYFIKRLLHSWKVRQYY